MGAAPSTDRLRPRLAAARLHLVFTPDLAPRGRADEVLAALLPHVDVVQVRAKRVGPHGGPCDAHATWHWASRALALARALPDPPLVLVDDRVDAALALLAAGLAGVHLGESDLAPEAARALLGREPLIGLSTHDLAAVVAAGERPVDYVGFGPIHATSTKGYERGLGAEAAWIAAAGSTLPVVAIGGIDLANAQELAPVGRVAVGSALLAADDPVSAARALRAALTGSTA